MRPELEFNKPITVSLSRDDRYDLQRARDINFPNGSADATGVSRVFHSGDNSFEKHVRGKLFGGVLTRYGFYKAFSRGVRVLFQVRLTVPGKLRRNISSTLVNFVATDVTWNSRRATYADGKLLPAWNRAFGLDNHFFRPLGDGTDSGKRRRNVKLSSQIIFLACV